MKKICLFLYYEFAHAAFKMFSRNVDLCMESYGWSLVLRLLFVVYNDVICMSPMPLFFRLQIQFQSDLLFLNGMII